MSDPTEFKVTLGYLWFSLIEHSDEVTLGNIDDYVKEGGDIMAECEKKGDTLLHYAASMNRPACIEKLINYRIDINVIDHYKKTPLHCAICHGSIDAVITLLRLGADVSRNTGADCDALSYANSFRSIPSRTIYLILKEHAETNVDAKRAGQRR